MPLPPTTKSLRLAFRSNSPQPSSSALSVTTAKAGEQLCNAPRAVSLYLCCERFHIPSDLIFERWCGSGLLLTRVVVAMLWCAPLFPFQKNLSTGYCSQGLRRRRSHVTAVCRGCMNCTGHTGAHRYRRALQTGSLEGVQSSAQTTHAFQKKFS